MMNLSSEVLDEIALEGLDGITIEALWVRLLNRKGFILPPKDEHSKLYIWNIVRRLRDIEFYKLKEPRKPLVIFDRWNNTEDDLGMVMEPTVIPEDIYPHCRISDPDNKIQGSCSTYYTRENVSNQVRKLKLEEVFDKFGMERIVIVANQMARCRALMGNHHNPNLKLTDFQYCCLERVGRSRYHGEVTQGKMGLQVLGVDTKTIFYFRKFLLKQKLITKQVFHMRNKHIHLGGRLMHLPRFYRLVKPKFVTLTESIIDFLMTQPDYMCEMSKLKESLGITCSLKKLTKMPDFQKYVKSDAKVPYRALYPNADTKDWKHKASDKEKRVRVLYLVDPSFDTKEIQRKLEGNDEDDEDEDNENEETHRQGFLNQSKRCFDRPIVLQVLKILENAGPNGLSATELTQECGLSKLNMRAICKSMLRSNLIGSFMADVDRQRVTRYFVNSGDRVGDINAQFTSEELKFSNLTNNDNKCDVDETQINAVEGCSSSNLADNEFRSETMPGDDNKIRSELDLDDNNVSRLPQNVTRDEIMELDGVADKEEEKGEEDVEGNEDREDEGGKKVEEDKAEEREDDRVIEKGITKEGRVEEKEEEENVNNSKTVQQPHCSKKSLKRTIDVDEDSGSSLPKKSKLKVKTVVDLNNGCNSVNSLENSVTNTVEPMNVTPQSIANVTADVDMSTLEPSDSGEAASSQDNDFHIDIQITDDLNWLKVRGYLSKDIDRSSISDGYKTVRSLKRWNMILETVQSHKVITNLKNIHTVINDQESKEGLNTRIDRKSLLRILYKMAVDRLIKIYKAIFKSGEAAHEINFICSSSVTPEHPLIKSAIDLAKLKFSSKIKLQNENSIMKQCAPLDSVKEEEILLTNKFDFSEENKSNLDVPKFMRMRYLHMFIYYLVYGYEGSVDLDQTEAVNQIRASQGFAEDDFESLSFIYVPSANWKMFVPPLPQHREYRNGWALLADIILRLPLSMFLQLVRLPYIIPNIELYIDHPIKRHLLVKDLPVPIRNCLTFKRKYIFSIYEVMTRLAYIGLVQLGPQNFKEKDHVYLYLNENALLLDTKPSHPGYHKVTTDMTYSELKYHFENMIDVERYWLDMWKICMHTKLGSRSCVVGTELILENIQDKRDMVDVLSARTQEEVVERDVGYLPGDKLGAAGFDSALFSHLKRNWSFKPFPRSRKTVLTVPEKSNQSLKKTFKLTEGKNQMVYSLLAKRRKNYTIPRKQSNPNTNTVLRKMSLANKPRVTVRHVKPKRNVKHRRPFYDQVDREALQRMNKLRVDWSKAEDKLLLLCKVVQLMITPTVKSTVLGNMYVSTREILHKTFPSSRNKTSRACQRRTNYMLKSQSTCHSLNLCIEELRHDSTIMETYGDLFEKLKAKHKKRENLVAEWNMHFKNLFEVLAKRFDNFSMLSLSNTATQTLPDTLEEFYAEFNVVEPTKKVKCKQRFNPVESINDIYCSVINSTIHSALCCSSDKISWSYHLFSVYQQYPEKLLRLTLAKMRTSMMVSLKRAWSRTKMRSGNYLPLTASPYRLSISYINLMTAKYSFDVFVDSFDLLKTIVQSKQQEIHSLAGGTTAGVVHMVTENIVDFEIGIPDQVIVLNPNVQNKDETYTRLMKRYQEILTSYKQEILTTSCLFQKDNYSTINTIEDESDSMDTISNNTIARTASRIALYLVKDSEEVGGLVPQELQHVHDFFVVNSCTVVSNLRNGLTDDELQVITDTSDMDNFQKQLKENVVFPANLMIDLDANKMITTHFHSDKIDIVEKLLELAKLEGNLGLTCGKILKEFGNSHVVKQILDELCQLRLLVCTGVVFTTYVHYKHVRPWLVHSYKNKRKDKDNRKPMTARVMELGEEILEEEDDEKKNENVDERKCNVDSNSRLRLGEDKQGMEEIDEDTTKERETECDDMLVVEHEEEMVGKDEEMFIVDVIRTGNKAGSKKQEGDGDNAMEVHCEKVGEESDKGLYKDNVIVVPENRGESDEGLDKVGVKEVQEDEELYKDCEKILQEDKESFNNSLKENIAVEGFFGKENRVEGDKERNLEGFKDNSLEDNFKDKSIEKGLKEKSLESFKELCLGEGSSEELVHSLEEQSNILLKIQGKDKNGDEGNHDNGDSSGTRKKEKNCDEDHSHGENSRKRARLEGDVVAEVETSKALSEASTSAKSDKDSDNRRRLVRSRDVISKVETSNAQSEVTTSVKYGKDTDNRNLSQPIKVLMRPWVKIDGSLNRRALDYMLSTVLSHIMLHPLSTLAELQERFLPALQPQHTRELAEMLQQMKCLESFICVKIGKSTLFSKPSEVLVKKATGLETPTEIRYEANKDAIINLGKLISMRQYNQGFMAVLVNK